MNKRKWSLEIAKAAKEMEMNQQELELQKMKLLRPLI
jgi:hypothetical protein